MRTSSPFSALLSLCLCLCLGSLPVFAFGVSSSRTRTYHLTEDVVGPGFYTHFDWEAVDDPSHGRVTYVDEKTSIAQNLTYASFDAFVLRPDYRTVLDPAGPGRYSVRISSKRTYTRHVAIFDIRHMPQGCGTWPGIRETKESDKPKGGLIDILEGINDEAPDLITLHTVANCTMPVNRTQTGSAPSSSFLSSHLPVFLPSSFLLLPPFSSFPSSTKDDRPNGQLDCNVAANANAGCGVYVPGAVNYEPGFNANGGGWYAVERTTEHISIWFWARDDPFVPLEVKHGGGVLPSLVVNPAHWGVPVAYFPDTTCGFETHFEEHNILINLTLCGDWAGNAYPSTCPSPCVDHVNNDPAAFEEAYFEFASLRVGV